MGPTRERFLRAAFLLLAPIAGCSHAATTAPRHPPVLPAAPDSSASVAPLAAGEIIAARSTGVWMGKPPLKLHAFDIILHNPAAVPRWLVLPSTFPSNGDVRPEPGGVECEIQTFAIGPQTLLAHGVCGDFLAVHLAAGATLALSRVRIESWWQDIPDTAKLEVMVAREVLVGGAPLATLVGADVSPGGSLRAPDSAADLHATIAWHAESGVEVPITFQVETRAATVVPLVKR